MNKLAMILAAGAALLLAGCDMPSPDTTPAPQPITTGNATADSVISKVVTGCGYKLEFQTAIDLVKNYTPSGGVFVSLTDSLADAVCSVLTKKSATRMKASTKVLVLNGKAIVLKGQFVR